MHRLTQLNLDYFACKGVSVSHVLCEQQGKLCLITLNRVEKHNAFDDAMLAQLQRNIDEAQQNSSVNVIIIKANGAHFSAGADASWMQRTATLSEEDNIKDAMTLARMMHSLYSCSKPTIAMIQGAAFGGGAGIAAASDVVIAADTAYFSFSEVKLGLIPAVISPYVVKAIGSRAAIELFISADIIQAQRAYELQLVQHLVPENELLSFTLNHAEKIANLAPIAVKASKALVRQVEHLPIDESLQQLTASLIAQKRLSSEAQIGLNAFLNKKTPNWN